jgi:hypothetical protein
MEAASFEYFATTAWARVVTAEFFREQFVPVDDANAAFDVGFRGEAFSSLTHGFEKRNLRNLGSA